MYTVLFQGDSITDCGRETCGGHGYNALGLGPGYPMRVAARLSCDYPQVDWKFMNLGIGGHRSVDLYARWRRDCLNLKPDFLSIFVGINDTWHKFSRNDGVDVPRFARIYDEMLTWTKQELPGIKLLLIDPAVGIDFEDKTPFMPEVKERQAVIAELAKKYDALHLPLQQLLDEASKRAPQSHWYADGVHLTNAGQQLLADAWLYLAMPILKETVLK